jgi:hypothetical protein
MSYGDAERELRHGIAASPADPHLLTLLGYVLRTRSDQPAALRTSQAAHAERAENPASGTR